MGEAETETETFWTEFLRGVVRRGLVGVQLAISDAHAGLKAALAKVLGCSWQRCTVHVWRKLRSTNPLERFNKPGAGSKRAA